MDYIYWGCLLGGLVFSVLIVLFGEVLDGLFEGINFSFGDGPSFLQPMTVVGGITIFGAAGILLQYTGLTSVWILLLSLLAAIASSILIYFFYIIPMERAENSMSFSIKDLEGAIGEIITTVPPEGYGEVLVKTQGGYTNQIAASYTNEEILSGKKVIIVEVKDDTLYVTPYQTLDEEVSSLNHK
ncbi:MAG: protease [Bacillaceae bacterium]|nr:protease [Bacillaceae bacterium]